MINVAITGASGFVGQSLFKACADIGYGEDEFTILAITRKPIISALGGARHYCMGNLTGQTDFHSV